MDIMDYSLDGYKGVKADKLIGIFGDPIGHTLSPVIHDTLSAHLGFSERYVPFHVKADELDLCVGCAYREGILGLNITVPHKQAVIKSLASVDKAAADIGAVNTLVRTDGGYKGYNTDMQGLKDALDSENIKIKDSKVIMLGAGGAARAVAYMCGFYGAGFVYIINRTAERARALASDMNGLFGKDIFTAYEACDYKDIPKDGYIMIQCTSVGLKAGDGLPFDFDDDFYSMATAGIDLIYNPIRTPFLKKLEVMGVPAVNGLKMLLHQGILAYQLWNDVKISETLTDIVYLALRDELYGVSRSDNIVLIGYMGSGKTTVGRACAARLSYDFIDTDEYIEKREGMSISRIFAEKGEEYFRNLETDTIRKLAGSLSKTVVATGGGLPLRKENSEALKRLGKVYYLKANADTIYRRIKDSDTRPLIKCDNPYEKITTMIEDREPVYERASDIRLNADTDSVDEVLKYII